MTVFKNENQWFVVLKKAYHHRNSQLLSLDLMHFLDPTIL